MTEILFARKTDIDTINTSLASLLAMATASVVTVSAEAGLTNERRLNAATGISLTDTGAGNTLDVALNLSYTDVRYVLAVSPVGDNNLVRFNGTAGQVQEGQATLTDTGGLTIWGTDPSYTVWRGSADGTGTGYWAFKSRNASNPFAFDIVSDGDSLGFVKFAGADGTAQLVGASIDAAVDGTPGVGAMPTHLDFSTTADGASTPVARLRIGKSGHITQWGIGAARNFSQEGYSNDTSGMALASSKSRGVTAGSHVIVVDGDTLMEHSGYGSDGSTFIQSANIRFQVDGTPGLGDVPGRIQFSTRAAAGSVTVAMGISSAQAVSVGTSGALSTWEGSAQTYKLQVYNTDANAALGIGRFSADLNGPKLVFGKSRGAIGAYTIAADNDILGDILFQGSDGADFAHGARIRVSVDGAPGVNSIPTEIVFANTTAGDTGPTDTLTIGRRGYFLNYGNTAAHEMYRNEANANGAALTCFKTRHASNAFAHSVVSNGDDLLVLGGRGSDGTQFIAAAQLNFKVDAAAGANDMPGRMSFSTTANGTATLVERFRINRWGGVVVLGDTAGYPLSGMYIDADTPNFQVLGLTANYAAQTVTRFSADANPPRFIFAKSRGAFDAYTAVANNDVLGSISAQGSDGTNFSVGATINFVVRGTPGADDVPTEIVFATKTSGGSLSDVAGFAADGLFEVYGSNAQMEIYRAGADANATVIDLFKTRNASPFGHTIVNAADEVGRINFFASDGAAFQSVASIRAIVDGASGETPGANDMPGRLDFYTTADGGTQAYQHLIIYNARIGNVHVQGNDDGSGPGPILTLNRESASPAAGDYIGEIAFSGRDSGAGFQRYTTLDVKINDPTAGSEAGQFEVWLQKAGTLREMLEIGGHNAYLYKDDGANPGQIVAQHSVKLTSDNALTNSALAQPLFDGGGGTANGALTLDTGIYFFECILILSSMSATSGNGQFQVIGAGTATVTDYVYTIVGLDTTTPGTAAAQSGSAHLAATTGANMLAATTGTGLYATIRGTFDVTGAGTIIPSIALTTAAAAVVEEGSYFRCWRGSDTATATVGAWS